MLGNVGKERNTYTVSMDAMRTKNQDQPMAKGHCPRLSPHTLRVNLTAPQLPKAFFVYMYASQVKNVRRLGSDVVTTDPGAGLR